MLLVLARLRVHDRPRFHQRRCKESSVRVTLVQAVDNVQSAISPNSRCICCIFCLGVKDQDLPGSGRRCLLLRGDRRLWTAHRISIQRNNSCELLAVVPYIRTHQCLEHPRPSVPRTIIKIQRVTPESSGLTGGLGTHLRMPNSCTLVNDDASL